VAPIVGANIAGATYMAICDATKKR
jgi:hypothetical protein